MSPGVTPRTGNRNTVLCPGSSTGRPAPRQAFVLWPRPSRGPLGGSGGRLWWGEARHGVGGGRPGESQ